MNMDREIGKIVLHVQRLLHQIENTGDDEALRVLDDTLGIASSKVRCARRESHGGRHASAPRGMVQAVAG